MVDMKFGVQTLHMYRVYKCTLHFLPPPKYENTKNVILLLSKVKWENNNYHFMEPKKKNIFFYSREGGAIVHHVVPFSSITEVQTKDNKADLHLIVDY